ncbi:hypothetical protein ACTHGU_06660 [Chitinophagaceae bacterium MMS25-I14]
MGLFKFFSRKIHSSKPAAAPEEPSVQPPESFAPPIRRAISGPYNDADTNFIYQLLFCDRPELFRNDNPVELEYPWTVLLAEQPDAKQLQQLADDTTQESRTRIVAFNQLYEMGIVPQQRELLGVIIEMGLSGGLDVLAAYTDGSARYINHSEKLLIWEASTPESDKLIDDLFAVSNEVIKSIGRWEPERRPRPATGSVRLSFLVSDGLAFGEGPIQAMQNDPRGAPVIAAATQLMVYLTEQALSKNTN